MESDLPRLWPVSLVLVLGGVLAVRRWVRDQRVAERTAHDSPVRRLEGYRLTLVLTAFGLIVPFLLLLYIGAPDWIAFIAPAAIVACMAGALLLSMMIGWKRGGGST